MKLTRLTDAQRDLVDRNRGLAYHFAKRMTRALPELAPYYEDIVQQAMFGLMKAAQKNDPAKGSFAGFAWPHMLAALERVSANWAAPMRVPRSARRRGEQQHTTTLTEVRAHSVPPDDGTAKLDASRVLDALHDLQPRADTPKGRACRQRNVEVLLAFLNGETFKEIGARHGRTRQWAQQAVQELLGLGAEWATR